MEYVITIGILIYLGVSIIVSKSFMEDYLSMEKTNIIRGICAFLVLGKHIFPTYKNVRICSCFNFLLFIWIWTYIWIK